MPVLSFVRSRVFPAGTASDDRVMVGHELFAELTWVAPLAPEKVQEAARSSTFAMGLARTDAVLAASASQKVERGAIVFLNEESESNRRRRRRKWTVGSWRWTYLERRPSPPSYILYILLLGGTKASTEELISPHCDSRVRTCQFGAKVQYGQKRVDGWMDHHHVQAHI